MRQLGKLLCLFYLESEWNEIRDLTLQGLSEEEACLQMLGSASSALGEEVAERWGLPSAVRDGMKRFEIDPQADPNEPIPAAAHWLQRRGELFDQMSHEMTLPDEQQRTRGQKLKQTAM